MQHGPGVVRVEDRVLRKRDVRTGSGLDGSSPKDAPRCAAGLPDWSVRAGSPGCARIFKDGWRLIFSSEEGVFMAFSEILSKIEPLAVTISAIVSTGSLIFSALVICRERAEKRRVTLIVFLDNRKSITVRVCNHGLLPLQLLSLGMKGRKDLVPNEEYRNLKNGVGCHRNLEQSDPLKTGDCADLLLMDPKSFLDRNCDFRFFVTDSLGNRFFSSYRETKKSLR